MNAPTPRQQQVLDFIRQCLDADQPVPSVREIARQLKLKSSSSAQGHLTALRRKGWLEKAEGTEGAARSLRLAGETAKRVQGIPLLGAIPAGMADFRAQEPDGLVHVDVESLKIPRSSRIFALKVTGDSMIGKQIMDGDIVIMEQNADPKSGDVLRVAVCGLYYDELALGFEGKPLRQGWNALAFRKAEMDDKPCDAGFLDMIGAK